MRVKVQKILINIIIIALLVIISYGLSQYLFTSIPVSGVSMENTIQDGDVLLLYKQGSYQNGDIVVFNSHKVTDGEERYLVKRIIGMEGDTVEIIQDPSDGYYYVWLNGVKLVEEYIHPDNIMASEMARITVPEGMFFYMGDNRGLSVDSRTTGDLGYVSDIVGRAVLSYVIEDWDFDFLERWDIA